LSWLAEASGGDAFGRAAGEAADGAFETGAESKLHGEDVGGSAGEDAERYVRADHAVHGFIDGAIAAEDEDEVRAVTDRLGGEFGGVAGFAGGNEARMQTRAAKGVNGTL
jgi:hypothetical protein